MIEQLGFTLVVRSENQTSPNVPTQKPIYQVGDLVAQMRKLLETSYPEIWIEGEIGSLATPASGHLYFVLKDQSAQLKCAMFRQRASSNKYRAKEGDIVRVRAKISVYPARGEMQCIVQHMEESGEGVLQRRLEELTNKLANEGLFDPVHKKPIPAMPSKIGIVSSASGAAVHDVISTLKRRNPNISVIVYPCLVQGDGASEAICRAIEDANTHAACDLMIVCRGGGSLEDLWSFNDERVARAVFASALPIISGVGHEVDTTICDLVADMRAPTPTAAAELSSNDLQATKEKLSRWGADLQKRTARQFEQLSQQVDISYRQLKHPMHLLAKQRESTQMMAKRLLQLNSTQLERRQLKSQNIKRRLLPLSPKRQLAALNDRVSDVSRRLKSAQERQLEQQNSLLRLSAEKLELVSPLAVLARGYSVVSKQAMGKALILRDTKQVAVGDDIEVKLAHGELECRVSAVSNSD